MDQVGVRARRDQAATHREAQRGRVEPPVEARDPRASPAHVGTLELQPNRRRELRDTAHLQTEVHLHLRARERLRGGGIEHRLRVHPGMAGSSTARERRDCGDESRGHGPPAHCRRSVVSQVVSDAMGVREAIPRNQEAQEGVCSFAKSLFLGEIHEELVFPWPQTDEAEQDRIREPERADARVLRRDYRPAQDRAGALDRRPRGPRAGRAGPVRALRRPSSTAARASPRPATARVFETFAQIDAAVSRRHGRPPVDRLQGHLAVRHRRAEGALPPRPRDRPQARRLRADRAQGRLGRLQPASPGRSSSRTAPGC